MVLCIRYENPEQGTENTGDERRVELRVFSHKNGKVCHGNRPGDHANLSSHEYPL